MQGAGGGSATFEREEDAAVEDAAGVKDDFAGPINSAAYRGGVLPFSGQKPQGPATRDVAGTLSYSKTREFACDGAIGDACLAVRGGNPQGPATRNVAGTLSYSEMR